MHGGTGVRVLQAVTDGVKDAACSVLASPQTRGGHPTTKLSPIPPHNLRDMVELIDGPKQPYPERWQAGRPFPSIINLDLLC